MSSAQTYNQLIVLSNETHKQLKQKGFAYFMITDLKLDHKKGIYSLTVKAVKNLPYGMHYSCTGIDDPMITSFIYKRGLICEILVEPFE